MTAPADMPQCMLEGWRDMDTRGAEPLSDAELLQVCETAYVTTSWGNLAELMKRYARLVEETSSDGL